MAYFVFMIDLKDSRKMGEAARRESQARLKTAKAMISALLGSDARAAFSSGDSLQGFTEDPSAALRACLLTVCIMHPYGLRCGIGSGEIYVLDREEGTNANDGPAYHDALSALERAKKDGQEIVARFGTTGDALVNSLIHAAQLLKETNTAHQNEYVALACLLFLSRGIDVDIARQFYESLGYPNVERAADKNAEKRILAEMASHRSNTSLQNSYDMLRKSNALPIMEMYETCLEYLSDTKELK